MKTDPTTSAHLHDLSEVEAALKALHDGIQAQIAILTAAGAATAAAIADQAAIIAALKPPAPVIAPPAFGVVHVQSETTAGLGRTADGKGHILAAVHMAAFGSGQYGDSRDGSAFAGTRLARRGTGPAYLYASVAGKDLGTVDPWSAPDTSRLSSVANARTWASRTAAICQADPGITTALFWQEMKGYWSSSLNDWDNELLVRHYTAWAERMRELAPNIRLGGPYTTGGSTEAQRDRTHRRFAQLVKARPELVDVICWDHNDGSAHRWYTDLYASLGVDLPHVNTEWYPGGWNVASTPSVATVIGQLMAQLANDRMEAVLTWGGGSDAAMKATLWTGGTATPTPTWAALVAAAPFLRHRPIRPEGPGWRNAVGQLLTVNGSTVVIS